MAVKFHYLLLLFFIAFFRLSRASPQNIEVIYPFPTPSPAPEPFSADNPIPGSIPVSQPPPPPAPPPPPSPSSDDNTNKTIAKAVAATAASTIVIAAIFFFCIRKYALGQRRRERVGDSFQGGQPPRMAAAPPTSDEFARVNGNIKGLIVDENGLDVLYWRELQEGENKTGYRKEILQSPRDEEEGGGGGGGGGGGMIRIGSKRRSKKVEPVHEIPLLRGKSSTSHVPPPEDDDSSGNISPQLPPPPSHGIVLRAVEKSEAPVQSKFLPPASPPLPIQDNRSKSPVTPPPPPASPNRTPAPPPPSPVLPAKGPAPPPPPPVPAKGPAPPPPPPKAGGPIATSLKPTPAARDKPGRDEPGESSGNNQVKLKPLHWDKVNRNVEHSMVWDKINGGSFK